MRQPWNLRQIMSGIHLKSDQIQHFIAAMTSCIKFINCCHRWFQTQLFATRSVNLKALFIIKRDIFWCVYKRTRINQLSLYNVHTMPTLLDSNVNQKTSEMNHSMYLRMLYSSFDFQLHKNAFTHVCLPPIMRQFLRLLHHFKSI